MCQHQKSPILFKINQIPLYSQLHKLQANQLYYPYFSAEKTDACFEVEKLTDNRLRFIGREKNMVVLDHTVKPDQLQPLHKGSFHLERKDTDILWVYLGSDHSQMAFTVSDNGDITLVPAKTETSYKTRKRWAFRTTGNLFNHTASNFYFLYLQASQIHNYSLLKCFGLDTQQSYFFNKGILHLGDDTGPASLGVYQEYLPLINQEAQPHYQENVIDDYGVTIAEKGLKIGQMIHRVHQFVDTEQLELDQAPLEVFQQLNVAGPIIGATPHVINYGSMCARAITPSLSLQDWTNIR